MGDEVTPRLNEKALPWPHEAPPALPQAPPGIYPVHHIVVVVVVGLLASATGASAYRPGSEPPTKPSKPAL